LKNERIPFSYDDFTQWFNESKIITSLSDVSIDVSSVRDFQSRSAVIYDGPSTINVPFNWYGWFWNSKLNAAILSVFLPI